MSGARLQFNFKETPGTVCVNAKEVFTVLKQSNTQIDLSQHTLSCLVSNIFPSTTIHRKKRGIEYQGLQRKTAYDKACDTSEIDKIATDNKFFKIPDEECFKYGFMTGDCINKVEIMKIIEIKPDRTWRSIIAGKEIDKEVIGLSKLACYNFESVAIIFNTIRLARICRGKHVLRKLSARRTSYLQEWSQSNNESGIEMRLTSGNCHTILSFMATSDTCNVCSKQNISRSTLEHNTEVDLFKEHFPGATDLMLKMLKQQSEICKHDKDSRTVRWNKDIIQIALTLWNSVDPYQQRKEPSAVQLSVVPYQQKKKPTTRAAIDAYNEIIHPEDYSFLRIENILAAKDEEPRKAMSPRGKAKHQPAEGAKSCSKCLKMNNNSITNLECIVEFSKHKFQFWEGITWIDLSQNEITKLGPELSEFYNLQILYLHGNQINDISQLDQLTPLTQLRKLTLHGNPIEATKGYRFLVLSKLPGLQNLDFSCVTKADKMTTKTFQNMKVWGGKKKKRSEEDDD